jgi:drug/metabolite transporter (DMT)-like permease
LSKKVLLAHIALLVVALFYGANYLIAKGLMPDRIGPSGFIVLRVSGAGALFWLLYAFNRERVAASDIPRLAACGLFGVAANQLLFFNGLSQTSPVNASIIMTSNPILVLVASAIILKTQVTGRKLTGIALGAAGAVSLLLLSKGSDATHISWKGDLMVFLNAMAYGIYLVMVKPLMAKYKPLTVITWVFLFGWLVALPIGIGQVTEIDWSAFEMKHILGVLYVVIGTTFLVYLLNIFALRVVQPTVVSVYIYLQPLFAGIFAFIYAFFGGEDFTGDITWVRAVCALLIFAGVYLVSVPPRSWGPFRRR